METIKDYLHLYLGCDCIGYYKIRDEDVGEVVVELKKKLLRVGVDGQAWLSGNVRVTEFKPILRPLSSITKRELAFLEGTRRPITDGVHTVVVNVDTPDSFQFLLSNHFDLFGLIERGLAIEKKVTIAEETKEDIKPLRKCGERNWE